ncbi:hypothetical protein [Oceanidesulfovibrio marinus]|uniref:Uncharacterized protein n=1 Tax=Oceanidesulfovibrio marinus TaxID=370038 RepID=A0ABX6NJ46_9BACT|nr:hypothetical protein [Oceanidesulfovibrio marinus]QJT10236.1 hypothetical protein E8L03_15435 [Oceanidesulfovibrio marinus]
MEETNIVEVTGSVEEKKVWYTSKEIWTSIVTLVCGVLLLFGIQVDPDTQAQLPVVITGGVVSFASLLKIIFRIFSSRKKLTATSAKALS